MKETIIIELTVEITYMKPEGRKHAVDAAKEAYVNVRGAHFEDGGYSAKSVSAKEQTH